MRRMTALMVTAVTVEAPAACAADEQTSPVTVTVTDVDDAVGYDLAGVLHERDDS